MLLNKKFYLLLFTFLLMLLNSQCKKTDYSDDNFFGGKVIILGHRGMGEFYYRPGNTYESIIPVLGIGADGAELDVQLTKDSVLVLFHDHYLNSETTCAGRVYESNWNEIKECRYTSLLQFKIYINSLDELFSKIPNLNTLYFSFDCSKTDNDVENKKLYRYQYLRAIKRLCEKYNMSNNIFIEGDVYLLKMAQELGLTNKLFLFCGLNEEEIDLAFSNHFFGISTSIDDLNDKISVAHQKGLYVMVWSPDNYSQNKKALKYNADIIQTDDPMSILKLLSRFNYEYDIP